MEPLVAICGLIITITVICFFKWKYTYWSRYGLKETLPTRIPFGNMWDVFTGKTSTFEKIQQIYFELKSKNYKHGGLYFLAGPIYFPISLKIIRHILQKDFNYFVNHGMYENQKVDPLTSHLFNLKDAKWKNLRSKITPTLTSGKIKMMFHIMYECSNELIAVLDGHALKNESVEIKDVLDRFTTDVTVLAAFGLESNTLKDPDAKFRAVGNTVFGNNWLSFIKTVSTFAFPVKLLKMLKMKLTVQETEDFFMKIVKDTLEYRENCNVERNDFVHMLIQLKNRGFVSDDGKMFNENGAKGNNMEFNELVALCFGFFLGGYETSSTTSSFAIYELAKNLEMQEKTREEIKRVLGKYGGKITYEAMTEMTYLEQIINESLRLYPPVAILMRECNEDYKIPETDIILKQGIKVIIPVSGIHQDPEYYPNPEKFDPDRFSEKNKPKIPPLAWLPFGEGPRMCIGIRFGMMQSKVALATILKNYKITLNKKTLDPVTYDKTTLLTSLEGGVWLNLTKII